MRNWLIIVAAAALLAANGVRAQEQNVTNVPHHPQPEHLAVRMPGGFLQPRIVDMLSLTDEQKTKLKDLEAAFVKARDEWRAAHKDVGTEMQKLREEASAARKAGDNAKLEETRKKMQELSGPMTVLRTKYIDLFRATLTDEQKQKLGTALEGMQQRLANPAQGKPATPPAPKPAE
jgi:Spy/CpxP family protein refolding chaperone